MKIINNYNNVKNCILIDSWKDWKTISIFAWIHWDEVSWIKALEKFFNKIKSLEISIKKWKLILVLKANEKAIEKNKRQVKYNLNRLFKDDLEKIDDYEYKRSVELKEILKETDFMLDLHSTAGPSIPFIFSEMKNIDIVKNLWVSHMIVWWEDIGWVVSGDTETYINYKSWIWFTFEAWDHNNPDWEKNAYQMILNFLSYLWALDNKYFKNIWESKQNLIKMESLYIAKSENFKYKINNIDNFKEIKKGTIIWKDDKKEIIAENDLIFIMPKTEDIIKKWIEVFFIWKSLF